jgi:hypothetical protein
VSLVPPDLETIRRLARPARPDDAPVTVDDLPLRDIPHDPDEVPAYPLLTRALLLSQTAMIGRIRGRKIDGSGKMTVVICRTCASGDALGVLWDASTCQPPPAYGDLFEGFMPPPEHTQTWHKEREWDKGTRPGIPTCQRAYLVIIGRALTVSQLHLPLRCARCGPRSVGVGSLALGRPIIRVPPPPPLYTHRRT